MAKGSRGGKRNSVSGSTTAPKIQIQPTQVTPPSPQDVANGNVLPKGGVPFDQFEKMTDDEKADVVIKALGVGLPMFLDNSDIQKLSYYTGMSEKPQVVSDSQLDKMKGTEIFRTVNDAYNSSNDIGYTANDICKQIAYGDFTMYSDSGGSAHGKAIYFASNLGSSKVYGNGSKAVTMRAKITGGKVITESSLDNMYHRALSRGDKLAVACSQASDSRSRVNMYGLAKGYDVKTSDYGDYVMVLNRRALTVSSNFKKTNSLGSRWN